MIIEYFQLKGFQVLILLTFPFDYNLEEWEEQNQSKTDQ